MVPHVAARLLHCSNIKQRHGWSRENCRIRRPVNGEWLLVQASAFL
jgi:hypothetical protein